MDSYLMMLYVTLEQESALKNFFVDKGWTYRKPDLLVTTDKLGPSVTTPSVPLVDTADTENTVAVQNKQVSSELVTNYPKSNPSSSRSIVKEQEPLAKNKGKRKTELPRPLAIKVKQAKVLLPKSSVPEPKSAEHINTKTEIVSIVSKPNNAGSSLMPVTVVGEDGKQFTIKVEKDFDDLHGSVENVDSGHDDFCDDAGDISHKDDDTFNVDNDDNLHDDGDDINDESTDMDYSNDEVLGTTSVNTTTDSSMDMITPKEFSRSNCKMQSTPVSGQRTFRSVSSDDIETFIDLNQQNKNTLRKTTGDTTLFKTFCETKKEFRSLEMIPPYQLNQLLCEFILSVTKKNGTEYEPTSLRCIIGSIHRYLRTNDYHWSIITSSEFRNAREVLKTKQKQLKMLGKGHGGKTKPADQIDDDLIEKFYQCGVLGDGNPRALIHTLWMICTKHFGIRTGQEAYNMRWGDVQLKKDRFGEYLLYDPEVQSKAKTDSRSCKAIVYAMNDPQRDPVHLYKLYLNHRPARMMSADSHFFLSVANSAPNHLQTWYKTQPMGINKLYNILRDMKIEADIKIDQRSFW